MRTWWLVLCLWVAGGWLGCTEEPEVGQFESLLQQTRTCDEVLEALQQDAIAKVDLELEAFVEESPHFRGGPVFFGDAEGFPNSAPTLDGGAGGDADAPSDFSDTNRQVAGVDEADIVKVGGEGTKLYVIRGNGFYEFDSWPAADTSKVADLEIEGGPIEMFVEGDRAVVFSNVFGLEALDDGTTCYGGGPEPFVDVAASDVAFPGPSFCRSFVKTTVISLGGDEPEVLRELYVEGYYTSSRRHDSIVRAVIQTHVQQPASVPNRWEVVYGNNESYPQSREEEIDRTRLWAAAAKSAIAETTLEEWLPVWGERVGGEVQAGVPQCADFYAPPPGFADYGMTQIVGLDLDDDADAAITSILGSASQVYSNGETLILTQPDYAWYDHDVDSDRTAVHRFAISFEQRRTLYQGSGFVPGIVNDQFSIDERDGVIRIATTRQTFADVQADVWVPPVTDNLVSTLVLDEGALTIAGMTPPLARDERIFSARFIGDLAYVVTFRQIDPLFAIDLSDPEDPRVLGELKIPGFSDYMHPLGDDHLLTIGRDIDEETQFDNGTALQIFDVSDPTQPAQKFKALVGDGFSEANHYHKAFNFYASQGLLAFPFVSYESAFSSTLELWDVSVEEGLRRRGSVDHSSLVVDNCPGWSPPIGAPFVTDQFYVECGYLPQVTRGVFIDEYIYSISHGGVMVHAVGDLQTPVATAPF